MAVHLQNLNRLVRLPHRTLEATATAVQVNLQQGNSTQHTDWLAHPNQAGNAACQADAPHELGCEPQLVGLKIEEGSVGSRRRLHGNDTGHQMSDRLSGLSGLQQKGEQKY